MESIGGFLLELSSKKTGVLKMSLLILYTPTGVYHMNKFKIAKQLSM